MYRRPQSYEGKPRVTSGAEDELSRVQRTQPGYHSSNIPSHPVGPAFIFQLENDPKHAAWLCQSHPSRRDGALRQTTRPPQLPDPQSKGQRAPKCSAPLRMPSQLLEAHLKGHHESFSNCWLYWLFLNSKHVHSQFWCLQWKTINWQGVSEPLTGGVRQHCSLPMRCNPLTLTGPTPAFSLMVTGAFSSNSPRLTWRMGIH